MAHLLRAVGGVRGGVEAVGLVVGVGDGRVVDGDVPSHPAPAPPPAPPLLAGVAAPAGPLARPLVRLRPRHLRHSYHSIAISNNVIHMAWTLAVTIIIIHNLIHLQIASFHLMQL